MMAQGDAYTIRWYSCAETLQRRGFNIDPNWRSPCFPDGGSRISIADIQNAVAERFGIHPREMKSARRGFAVAHPRQVAMYLCRELTPRPLPEIGRWFSRDHTTVIHAIRQVEKRRAADLELDRAINALSAILQSRPRQPVPQLNIPDREEESPERETAAWCSQCERRAFPSEARKCASRWCRLRGGEASA